MSDKVSELLAFINNNIERTLSRCTSCGKCYDVCPMPSYSEVLKGKESRRVVAEVLGILRGEKASAEALEWTRLCTQSSTCIAACPENVNPMMMMRLSRIVALGSTGVASQLPNNKNDPHFFARITAFSSLQLSDLERPTSTKIEVNEHER